MQKPKQHYYYWQLKIFPEKDKLYIEHVINKRKNPSLKIRTLYALSISPENLAGILLKMERKSKIRTTENLGSKFSFRQF